MHKFMIVLLLYSMPQTTIMPILNIDNMRYKGFDRGGITSLGSKVM